MRTIANKQRPIGFKCPPRQHKFVERLESRTFLSASALDTSFNGNGKVIAPWADSTFQSVVTLPDGKVLAAGTIDTHGPTGMDFLLARYNANGTPDTTFGGGTGRVLTDFGGGLDIGRNVILAGGGKFIVIGDGNGIIMARYNANGTLDTTFGTGGKSKTQFTVASLSAANHLAILSDGKLLVVGTASVGMKFGIAMARFNSNGKLDTTFGNGTGQRFSYLGGVGDDAGAVAVLPGGGFLVAGGQILNGDNSGNARDILLAKYLPSGAIDKSFGGGDGWVTTNIKGADAAESMAVLSSGKIVVAGGCNMNFVDTVSNPDVALVRYNANGSLDTSFGSNHTGVVRTDYQHRDDDGHSLLVQPNGKLLVVGTTDGYRTLAVFRYNANGTLDTSFSGDGKQTVAGIEGIGGASFAPGGKYVVTGSAFINDAERAALVRFGSDFTATASVAGTVYNDKNGNGHRDTGEPGLAGWQVYVDSNNDGFYTPGEAVATTDSTGKYKITGLVPGSYRVREVRFSAWTRTQPAGVYPLGFYDVSVTTVGQSVVGKDFGNKL